MDQDLRDRLRQLKFEEFGSFGAMRVRVEDVEFVAISNPTWLALIVTHIGSRTMAQFENQLPHTATVQEIAQVMQHALKQIHPDRRQA